MVHQGRPSSLYDASCDGTWLLMKDIYAKRQWGTEYVLNGYDVSEIHSYLSSTLLDLLEPKVKDVVKEVKIPYHLGHGREMVSGSSGLKCKLFLLGVCELGGSSGTVANCPDDGACLSYFAGTAIPDERRIADFNGSPDIYWTRTPSLYGVYLDLAVNKSGGFSSYNRDVAYGIRPALILPQKTRYSTQTRKLL